MEHKMKMDILPIFPITLGIVRLGREFTSKELKIFKNLELIKNVGNGVSKDTRVLEKPELKKLKEFCYNNINAYMKEIYKPTNKINLRITQSWVNFTKRGEYHHKHTHLNSAFSAAFYIKTHKEDKIFFYRPNDPIIKFDSESYDSLNSDSWWVTAEEGMMVMFPSWLPHDVKPKDHDGDRISLSFNTFYVGTIGNDISKTELILK